VRVGLVGGTFDPIHVGHLAMARAARDCAALDLVLLMPSAEPPHRQPATAAAEDRLEMCRLAAAGQTGIEVSDLEVRRSGRSYTVDTLEELVRSRPGDSLHLVLGWDAARELRSWERLERVLDLASLVVVARPGFPDPSALDLRAAGLDPARVIVCADRTPDVEATVIRERLARGGELEGLIDPRVAEYIRSRGLYGSVGG
jgi:nicotinate-nucleotide adenylyltransferase